ncbi:MAG: type II toxin-antitoxin system VapC family toxin [Thermoproteota archaeon]|jgi:Predicted nucleic acid-binding protein, contains PIN domain
MKVVLDASAIAKWFLIEKETDYMKRIRNEIASKKLEAHVPDLIFIELANVLRYSNLSENDVELGIKAAMQIGLVLHRFEELIYDAIKIAFENDITIYDALYVSLSKSLEAPLITYDEMLLKKVNRAKKASELHI